MLSRIGGVRRIGIGDVEREVIGAVRVTPIDRVSPFRCALIALEPLGAIRPISKLNMVDDLDDPSAGPLFHPSLGLEHADQLYRRKRGLGNRLGIGSANAQQKQKRREL